MHMSKKLALIFFLGCGSAKIFKQSALPDSIAVLAKVEEP